MRRISYGVLQTLMQRISEGVQHILMQRTSQCAPKILMQKNLKLRCTGNFNAKELLVNVYCKF